MTGNAKSEAPELHELSSEELDAVSGGTTISEQAKIDAAANAKQAAEDKKQAEFIKATSQILTGA